MTHKEGFKTITAWSTAEAIKKMVEHLNKHLQYKWEDIAEKMLMTEEKNESQPEVGLYYRYGKLAFNESYSSQTTDKSTQRYILEITEINQTEKFKDQYTFYYDVFLQ